MYKQFQIASCSILLLGISVITAQSVQPEILVHAPLQLMNHASTSSKLTVPIAATEKRIAGHDMSIFYEDQPQLMSLYKQFLKDNPNIETITSPNYPEPYPKKVNKIWNLSVDNATGIDVTVHFLDLNWNSDYLIIRSGTEKNMDKHGVLLTATITEPVKYKFIDTTTLYIQFVAQRDDDTEPQLNKGFALAYSPFGFVAATTQSPVEEITLPTDQLHYLRRYLEIPPINQNNATWHAIRIHLCSATDNYTAKHNLNLKECEPKDVYFSNILRCPNSWKRHEICVEIEFAIHLPFVMLTTDENPAENQISNTTNYQLTVEHLEGIWNEFAIKELQVNGIQIYESPTNDKILWIWVCISAGVVCAFLLVLYGIWKLDFVQDYRASTTHEDKRTILKSNSDIDIAMFPAPHQLVPSLFSNADTFPQINKSNYDSIPDHNDDFKALHFNTFLQRPLHLDDPASNDQLSHTIAFLSNMDNGETVSPGLKAGVFLNNTGHDESKT